MPLWIPPRSFDPAPLIWLDCIRSEGISPDFIAPQVCSFSFVHFFRSSYFWWIRVQKPPCRAALPATSRCRWWQSAAECLPCWMTGLLLGMDVVGLGRHCSQTKISEFVFFQCTKKKPKVEAWITENLERNILERVKYRRKVFFLKISLCKIIFEHTVARICVTLSLEIELRSDVLGERCRVITPFSASFNRDTIRSLGRPVTDTPFI